MKPACENIEGGPTLLPTLRDLFQDPSASESLFEVFKNLELAAQLAIHDAVENAELWLWSHNGAFHCHEFTLFVKNLADRLWELHKRSAEFQEEIFQDDVRDTWGSW
jgi:hypothetical protein